MEEDRPSTVGVAGCPLSARPEAPFSGAARGPVFRHAMPGVQIPPPLGIAPVTPRGAVPRGLRSRLARAPPLGAALRMLGSAGGRAGGGDLETPEGWKRRRRRRRRDARSSVGVCGVRPGPGAWASVVFAVRGAGLRVRGGIRAPGVSRVWRGRPCARTEHWGGLGTGWLGVQRPQAEAGRSWDPGWGARLQGQHLTVVPRPGLALQGAGCIVCVCVGVCLMGCLQVSCLCVGLSGHWPVLVALCARAGSRPVCSRPRQREAGAAATGFFQDV